MTGNNSFSWSKSHCSKFCFLIFSVTLIACHQKETPLFQLLPASETGLTFENTITENDSFNILVKEFVYNGGGVAVGDLNGDDLPDLFFTGNQVDNALFLNKGDLNFEEVTATANLQKPFAEQWSSGVNILDINLDGKKDIYISNTLASNPNYRKNLLYINQGNNDQNIPIFQELAAEYGIDDASHSSHAQFFDYDNDGDLDLFVGVNWIEREYPNRFIEEAVDGSAPNRDNLFENTWSDSLGHPIFTDVSIDAGIIYDGYSHSTLIYDFNEDGWQDIYVANDYQSNDLIFINNQDGTFSNRAKDIFKHFSLSSMGSDLGDINNDGKADFFTSEMQPYTNKQKKAFQGPSNYQNQQLTEQFDYTYQYPRNTLQLNRGINPEDSLPLYSEVGMYAQIQETDWSWSTLFADYNNDGWKDLFIANGFPKNIIDRDFSDFRASVRTVASTDYLVSLIPEIKVPNFIFENQGDLTFKDKSEAWGINVASFSNGAIYADLDNDGDLDLVTNNIDAPAFLFENTMNPLEIEDGNNRFLRIQLEGNEKNPDAFGAKAVITIDDEIQSSYLLSGRGYLSQTENTLHFGVGEQQMIDQVTVYWADGKVSQLEDIPTNQTITIAHQSAVLANIVKTKNNPLLQKTTIEGLQYTHTEIDFADFNFQRTLPHKFSQYGPAIAIGDINGDNLEDVFIGGNDQQAAHFFIQNINQEFDTVQFRSHNMGQEDMGVLLFDADQDNDLDLYLARGGSRFLEKDTSYQDEIWLNDGTGGFIQATPALPELHFNASCVKAADYDQDGDLDIFVGGSVRPFGYPYADQSVLLRNDTKGSDVRFTDVTTQVFATNESLGMVSDAIWTDFNNDFLPDLIIASKWHPIQFFKNNGQQLVNVTPSEIAKRKGWWNSLAAADLDNDGDMDYIAGNFGENLYYRGSADEPIRVYGKDLDDNGMVDPLISVYWKDSTGRKDEFLYHPRADMLNQYVGIRKKYNTYAEYGADNVSQMFSAEEMEGALIMEANDMRTVVIENTGDGNFIFHELPLEAQLAPVYGIQAADVNNDNRLDILMIGNDLGVEVQQGRADAFNGLVLLNEGAFSFNAISTEQSHFYVPKAGIGLVSMIYDEQELFLATQNRENLRIFRRAEITADQLIPLQPNEVKAVYYLADGQRVSEFYRGSSFMSQRGRYLKVGSDVRKVEVFEGTGALSRRIE